MMPRQKATRGERQEPAQATLVQTLLHSHVGDAETYSTKGSASFRGLCLHAPNLQEQVPVIVPRAKNDLSVCNDAERGNIEIVRRGKVQNLEVAEEIVGVLRTAGAPIKCQSGPRIAVPVLTGDRNSSTRLNESLPLALEDELQGLRGHPIGDHRCCVFHHQRFANPLRAIRHSAVCTCCVMMLVSTIPGSLSIFRISGTAGRARPPNRLKPDKAFHRTFTFESFNALVSAGRTTPGSPPMLMTAETA